MTPTPPPPPKRPPNYSSDPCDAIVAAIERAALEQAERDLELRREIRSAAFYLRLLVALACLGFILAALSF